MGRRSWRPGLARPRAVVTHQARATRALARSRGPRRGAVVRPVARMPHAEARGPVCPECLAVRSFAAAVPLTPASPGVVVRMVLEPRRSRQPGGRPPGQARRGKEQGRLEQGQRPGARQPARRARARHQPRMCSRRLDEPEMDRPGVDQPTKDRRRAGQREPDPWKPDRLGQPPRPFARSPPDRRPGHQAAWRRAVRLAWRPRAPSRFAACPPACLSPRPPAQGRCHRHRR